MIRIYLFFCCTLLCPGLYAQNFRLTGKITDDQKLPVQGAKVVLAVSSRTVFTDSAGCFMFGGVTAGEYQLSVVAAGYQTGNLRVRVKNKNTSIELKLLPASYQLKEVIVKNNRIETQQKQESLNIEVVNSSFIQRNLGGSLMKTLERLPGIKTIGIGSGQSKPLIRGLGFNRVVVVDKGVKHEGQQWGADHGLEIDQFAIGEVTLVKGAASFMYGSDAIAGVIDLRPAPMPVKNTLGGSVDLIGKTNNNLYGTSVGIHGRSDKLFFDSRFTYQRYGDYRVPADTIYIYDYSVKLDDRHLRNTAGLETSTHINVGYINNTFRSVFYLSNIYSKSGFFANAHGLEPRRVDAVLHDRSHRDIQLPNQQVNHFKLINRSALQVGKHSLESELGFQRNFRQEFSQYVNHGYMPPVYPSEMTIPADLEREFDKKVYTLNLRDHFTAGNHSLTAGVNGEYQDNQTSGWSFLVPSFKQKTAGIFLYDKLKLNEQTYLHGAVRYDYGQINMFKYTDWFSSAASTDPAVPAQNLVRSDRINRTFNSFVWSAGLNYNISQFSLKTNIGKSFRMPIAKELGANGVNYHYFSYEKGDAGLSPEQSYQIDLGLGWNEERWSVQLTPFYNYFPNYIYLNPTAEHDYYYGAGNQVFQYAQSEVMRYGAELQLKYKVTRKLSTEVLGEYLYVRQLSGDKKGYTLPFSPPASLLLNLTYSCDFGGKFKDSYFSVDYRMTARQSNIVPPEKKTPGYQVFNVQAGTKFHFFKQPLTLSLQAQNLLNTRYLNHTSFYRLIELPEAGRNLVLSLKIPFSANQSH